MKKIKVGILAGGMSSEHEISVISAGSLLNAIDRSRFEPILIGITKDGRWVTTPHDQPFSIHNGVLPEIKTGIVKSSGDLLESVDVIFPMLHGPYGEDGTVQGLCEMSGVKYVGSGVLSSAVAMDKSFAKPIFSAHGLQVAPGVVITKSNRNNIDVSHLTYPLFVKPARGGSSRGTSKVKEKSELSRAIDEAFKFDSKVMIESGVIGQEVECAVLQTSIGVKASPVGEIKVNSKYEFYDFDAKYFEGGSTLQIPANIPGDTQKLVQELAIKAFEALGCSGLARVDFFYSNGSIVINELNTMPGFTSTSVYPKLWQKAGISYTELITELIDGAALKS